MDVGLLARKCLGSVEAAVAASRSSVAVVEWRSELVPSALLLLLLLLQEVPSFVVLLVKIVLPLKTVASAVVLVLAASAQELAVWVQNPALIRDPVASTRDLVALAWILVELARVVLCAFAWPVVAA